MSERTTTLNGVQVSETQLREALERIEREKRPVAPAITLAPDGEVYLVLEGHAVDAAMPDYKEGDALVINFSSMDVTVDTPYVPDEDEERLATRAEIMSALDSFLESK